MNVKTFEFGNTSIPNQFSVDLKDNYGILWLDSRTPDFFRCFFASMASTLKYEQSKTTPRIGFTYKDDKGNFKMGMILVYHAPEEGSDDDSGNYYLQMTFNEEDMTNLDVSLDNHSDIFVRCAAQEAHSIIYGRFKNLELMNDMFVTCIDSIYKFLDTNASENEEVELVLRGVFTATVTIEDGKKIMSIVPGEYIKQVIKDDYSL